MNRFDDAAPSDVTILALRRLIDAMLDRPRDILRFFDMEPMTDEEELKLEWALADLVEDVVGPALDAAEQRRADAVAARLRARGIEPPEAIG